MAMPLLYMRAQRRRDERDDVNKAGEGEILGLVTQDGVSHLMTNNDGKLIIILTEIQHSAKYENVSTRQDEGILDRLVDHSDSPGFVINLSDVFVSAQKSVGHSGDPHILPPVVGNNIVSELLDEIFKLLPGYFLHLVRVQSYKSKEKCSLQDIPPLPPLPLPPSDWALLQVTLEGVEQSAGTGQSGVEELLPMKPSGLSQQDLPLSREVSPVDPGTPTHHSRCHQDEGELWWSLHEASHLLLL